MRSFLKRGCSPHPSRVWLVSELRCCITCLLQGSNQTVPLIPPVLWGSPLPGYPLFLLSQEEYLSTKRNISPLFFSFQHFCHFYTCSLTSMISVFTNQHLQFLTDCLLMSICFKFSFLSLTSFLGALYFSSIIPLYIHSFIPLLYSTSASCSILIILWITQ